MWRFLGKKSHIATPQGRPIWGPHMAGPHGRMGAPGVQLAPRLKRASRVWVRFFESISRYDEPKCEMDPALRPDDHPLALTIDWPATHRRNPERATRQEGMMVLVPCVLER